MERPSDSRPHDSRTDEAEMLRQILAAVEANKRGGRLQFVVAVVLSLATLTSTWCGYQARQWGGEGGSKQTAADSTERKAAENMILAFQRRTQDGLTILEYMKAVRAGDERAAEILKSHMHGSLREAVVASMDAGILTNPSVAGPLHRPEYKLEEEARAMAMRAEAARLQSEATTAVKIAGDYVLLTLVFASVLFFGGIGGTFSAPRIRSALAGLASLLFLVALVLLFRTPVY